MTSVILAVTYHRMAVVRKMSMCALEKRVQFLKKMKKIWRNIKTSLKVKTRLYEAIVLSTFLYSAELWPLSATLAKKT